MCLAAFSAGSWVSATICRFCASLYRRRRQRTKPPPAMSDVSSAIDNVPCRHRAQIHQPGTCGFIALVHTASHWPGCRDSADLTPITNAPLLHHPGGSVAKFEHCRYPISYRDLEAMMTERGVAVDHSTIYRWVQRFAPEMEKRLRWQWRRPRSRSWRIDETYVRVRGQWAYLYRALDKFGNTLDFYLSSTRNTKAAKRFLGKALNGLKDWELPEVLNTDKAPTYAGAIAELKAEGKCPNETRHRQVKYLNNVVEADHGKLKLLLRPVRGFKTLKTAYATIKGFEVMRALRKGQAGIFALQAGIVGEARIVERAFGLGPCALTEVMALLQNRLANAEA